jgi:hypothetical protein
MATRLSYFSRIVNSRADTHRDQQTQVLFIRKSEISRTNYYGVFLITTIHKCYKLNICVSPKVTY